KLYVLPRSAAEYILQRVYEFLLFGGVGEDHRELAYGRLGAAAVFVNFRRLKGRVIAGMRDEFRQIRFHLLSVAVEALLQFGDNTDLKQPFLWVLDQVVMRHPGIIDRLFVEKVYKIRDPDPLVEEQKRRIVAQHAEHSQPHFIGLGTLLGLIL